MLEPRLCIIIERLDRGGERSPLALHEARYLTTRSLNCTDRLVFLSIVIRPLYLDCGADMDDRRLRKRSEPVDCPDATIVSAEQDGPFDKLIFRGKTLLDLIVS
jgi:hypothetical protein